MTQIGNIKKQHKIDLIKKLIILNYISNANN